VARSPGSYELHRAAVISSRPEPFDFSCMRPPKEHGVRVVDSAPTQSRNLSSSNVDRNLTSCPFGTLGPCDSHRHPALGPRKIESLFANYPAPLPKCANVGSALVAGPLCLVAGAVRTQFAGPSLCVVPLFVCSSIMSQSSTTSCPVCLRASWRALAMPNYCQALLLSVLSVVQ